MTLYQFLVDERSLSNEATFSLPGYRFEVANLFLCDNVKNKYVLHLRN